jgi:hypothetical protein
VLARVVFPNEYPFSERLREKQSVTAHLPKGILDSSAQETTTTGYLKPYLALLSPTLLKFFQPKPVFGLFALTHWGKQLPESKVQGIAVNDN